MCGIAGFHLKPGAKIDPIALERFADALLFGIDSRGGDACGFVARSDSGAVVLQKATCTARQFTEERRWFPAGVRTVLLHTRFATQGDACFPENNHPVSAGSIHCVHNGHITNDYELMRSSGFERVGVVDSEAIPATVASRGWENAGSALEALDGAAAVALLDGDTGELILARASSSPLVVVESSSLIAWASTREALLVAWESTLGTAPHASRVKYTEEGTLLRFSPDGSRSQESFEVRAPVYTRSYFGGDSGSKSYADASEWKQEADGVWRRQKPAPSSSVSSLSEEERASLRRMLGVNDDAWDVDDSDDAWEEERRARDAREDEALLLGLEECTCCGDYFSSSSLSSVTHEGWRVCEACERWFGSALDSESEARAH